MRHRASWQVLRPFTTRACPSKAHVAGESTGMHQMQASCLEGSTHPFNTLRLPAWQRGKQLQILYQSGALRARYATAGARLSRCNMQQDRMPGRPACCYPGCNRLVWNAHSGPSSCNDRAADLREAAPK